MSNKARDHNIEQMLDTTNKTHTCEQMMVVALPCIALMLKDIADILEDFYELEDLKFQMGRR